MKEKIAKVAIDKLSEGAYTELTQQSKMQLSLIQQISAEINKINDLEVISLKENENIDRAQRFLRHLKEKYISDYTKLANKEIAVKQQIIESVTKLYFLTEQYFAALGLIQKPRFQMTGIVDGMYIQMDFESQLLEDPTKFLDLSNETRSGGAGLKFQTTKVIDALKKSIDTDEKQKLYATQLYNHYIKFSTPFRRAEKKGANINNGVVREAFEMHLENLHQQLNDEYDFKDCRMESTGKRWVLYRYASGSDPYFTGPDTQLSQIKAENASLVGNIDTILNVAKYIVEHQDLNKSLDQIKKSLKTQNQSDIHSFSEKLWEYLSEAAQKVVKNTLGQKKSDGNIVLKFT